MNTRRIATVAAACSAAVLVAPAALADPPGHGLYAGQHWSHCVGSPFPGGVYNGYVTLLPGAGATFWANGVHLVIQRYTYTPDNGVTESFTIGQGKRTGLAAVPTVVCTGHFDEGYTIESTSVAVP